MRACANTSGVVRVGGATSTTTARTHVRRATIDVHRHSSRVNPHQESKLRVCKLALHSPNGHTNEAHEFQTTRGDLCLHRTSAVLSKRRFENESKFTFWNLEFG